jgi:hypothetical protein
MRGVCGSCRTPVTEVNDRGRVWIHDGDHTVTERVERSGGPMWVSYPCESLIPVEVFAS